MTTAIQTRRIARFEKLYQTLVRTENLLIAAEITDGGACLERTRQNIASVTAILDAEKRHAAA